MAWIKIVEEKEAGEELQTIYERLKSSRGKISSILAVHSLNPRAMAAHLELYMAVMFGHSGISREEREAVAVAVSAADGCEYCLEHHTEALRHYWKDKRVRALVEDPRRVELPSRLRAMVEYALKLTARPWEMVEGDVDHLRSQGLSDEEVLGVSLVVGYFNFVNRVALGLGVEATPEETTGYKY